MEPVRGRIEEFVRRYWREGNRVLRVLAVAVAVLLLLLLALRVLRVLAVPALIGVILVVGWLLLGTLTIPRVSTTGPVVRNGVAAIVACGKKRGFEVVSAAPESLTGTWAVERKGECNVYYHHPPGWEQREARQQRAQE